MITINHNVQKASRKDAQYIVEQMLNGDERAFDTETLQSLYKYFMPALPRKAKTPFEWVAKAAGIKDAVRPYLHYVHVEHGIMYATDGHRLHFAPSELEDGNYCPKTGALVPDAPGPFPDCQRVICDRPDQNTVNVDSLEIKADGRDQVTHIADVRLNYKYLMDAMNGEKCTTIYTDGPSNSIRGKGQLGEYIIMPMRY